MEFALAGPDPRIALRAASRPERRRARRDRRAAGAARRSLADRPVDARNARGHRGPPRHPCRRPGGGSRPGAPAVQGERAQAQGAGPDREPGGRLSPVAARGARTSPTSVSVRHPSRVGTPGLSRAGAADTRSRGDPANQGRSRNFNDQSMDGRGAGRRGAGRPRHGAREEATTPRRTRPPRRATSTAPSTRRRPTKGKTYIFKGVYKGEGVVTVAKGNSRVRKGGYVGQDVTFDLSDGEARRRRHRRRPRHHRRRRPGRRRGARPGPPAARHQGAGRRGAARRQESTDEPVTEEAPPPPTRSRRASSSTRRTRPSRTPTRRTRPPRLPSA